jgi:hypothetical protein
VGISILYLSCLQVIVMGEHQSIQQVNLMNCTISWVDGRNGLCQCRCAKIQEHWGEGKLGICTLEGTKYMEETRMVECYLEVYC